MKQESSTLLVGLEGKRQKSAKSPTLPSAEEVDLQLGLYYLALEQHYGRSLRRVSLLFLSTGERVTYEATDEHRAQVQGVVAELAQRLRDEDEWEPRCGSQCGRCSYQESASAPLIA